MKSYTLGDFAEGGFINDRSGRATAAVRKTLAQPVTDPNAIRKGGATMRGNRRVGTPNPDPSVFTPGTIENLAHPTMPDPTEPDGMVKPDGSATAFASNGDRPGGYTAGDDPWTPQAKQQIGIPDQPETSVKGAEGEVSPPTQVAGKEPFTPGVQRWVSDEPLNAGGIETASGAQGDQA